MATVILAMSMIGTFLAASVLLILNGHPWFGGVCLLAACSVRVSGTDETTTTRKIDAE